uniref:C2 domain-containing protein n=1 Tax=Moschus moschiferus TaxID=68415 RepID=A0A8C6FVQ8_MOSMO
MWVPDNSTAPLKMDSRCTSSAGLGDLNPLSTAIPATRVEVSVSCRYIYFFHLFVVCVLYIQGVGNKEWREFGRTEVIDNTLNPDFVRKFILDYFFEERENLRFDLCLTNSAYTPGGSSYISMADFLRSLDFSQLILLHGECVHTQSCLDYLQPHGL